MYVKDTSISPSRSMKHFKCILNVHFKCILNEHYTSSFIDVHIVKSKKILRTFMQVCSLIDHKYIQQDFLITVLKYVI